MIGLSLAQYTSQVLGIELMEQAVEDARWTAAFSGTLLTFWGEIKSCSCPVLWERLCGKGHLLYSWLGRKGRWSGVLRVGSWWLSKRGPPFFFLFFKKKWSIVDFNVVLVSGIQQSDSVICIYIYVYVLFQIIFPGLPWWRSGWESCCQCRGHGFRPWSRRIPHAAEQLGPCTTTAEPAL